MSEDTDSGKIDLTFKYNPDDVSVSFDSEGNETITIKDALFVDDDGWQVRTVTYSKDGLKLEEPTIFWKF